MTPPLAESNRAQRGLNGQAHQNNFYFGLCMVFRNRMQVVVYAGIAAD